MRLAGVLIVLMMGFSGARGQSVADYQPVFELLSVMQWLTQMQGAPAVASVRPQAQQISEKLGPLRTQEALTPAEAQILLTDLEALLTPAQREWLKTQREARDLRVKKTLATGRFAVEGQARPNVYSLSLAGYNTMTRLIAEGKPFNPFRLEPHSRTLERYLLLLRMQR